MLAKFKHILIKMEMEMRFLIIYEKISAVELSHFLGKNIVDRVPLLYG